MKLPSNLRLNLSVRRKLLCTPRLTVHAPGPTRELAGQLPYIPAAGTENAAGFRYKALLSHAQLELPVYGSTPVQSGRLAPLLRLWSQDDVASYWGEKYWPLCITMALESCQPPTTASIALEAVDAQACPLPKGTSHTTVGTKRCLGTSVLLPQS